MVRKPSKARARDVLNEPTKVAVACQGGGIHASFEVGVLSEILKNMQTRNDDPNEQHRFELVALSGTSAGALCSLMVWYGLASKNGQAGSPRAAIKQLNDFWDRFAARGGVEVILNALTYAAFKAREQEVFGVNAPILSLNPSGVIAGAVTAALSPLGVRRRYYDLPKLLEKACPQFDNIDWDTLETRLLVGATEIINGVETVFDSDRNMVGDGHKHHDPSTVTHQWRQRLPLSLAGVAASGTLPEFREAERIEGGSYWDGLYSQNPPIRELLSGVDKQYTPDEIWVLRINPQQCLHEPQSNAEIQDRKNELMGNLSLNKELDTILLVNHFIDWFSTGSPPHVGDWYKKVTVRTIKMTKETAESLLYSSKFNRNHRFMDQLRNEGCRVARDWLRQWPYNVGSYPDDAAY
jgi:NTE family protein